MQKTPVAAAAFRKEQTARLLAQYARPVKGFSFKIPRGPVDRLKEIRFPKEFHR